MYGSLLRCRYDIDMTKCIYCGELQLLRPRSLFKMLSHHAFLPDSKTLQDGQRL
jgi:hypothetical protein